MLAKATRLSGRRRNPSGGKYRPDRLPWRTISAGRADFGRMAGSQVGSCEGAPKCRSGAWAGGSLLPFAPSQGRRCIDPLPVRPRSAPELSSQVANWSSLRRTLPPPAPRLPLGLAQNKPLCRGRTRVLLIWGLLPRALQAGGRSGSWCSSVPRARERPH